MANNLEKILENTEQNKQELKFYLEHILSGDASDEEIKMTLIQLNKHGIEYHLLSALVDVMNSLVEDIDFNTHNFVDTCGTGGSGLQIFNCSTISSFVVASCGGKVVKHGNKSITSKSGSADFLVRVGVNIENSFENSISAFNQFGITFLFAPKFHTQLKYVAQQRKELGVKTVFNVVGPLVNPGNPDYQIIGTSDSTINLDIAKVLKNKNLKKALIVSSKDGIDELSVTSNSDVYELKNGEINSYEINPLDYGLSIYDLSEIQVNSLEEAHLYGLEVLNGKRGAGHDMVALNAGAALYASDYVETIAEGIELASRELHSGRPLLLLNKYAKFTSEL